MLLTELSSLLENAKHPKLTYEELMLNQSVFVDPEVRWAQQTIGTWRPAWPFFPLAMQLRRLQ